MSRAELLAAAAGIAAAAALCDLARARLAGPLRASRGGRRPPRHPLLGALRLLGRALGRGPGAAGGPLGRGPGAAGGALGRGPGAAGGALGRGPGAGGSALSDRLAAAGVRMPEAEVAAIRAGAALAALLAALPLLGAAPGRLGIVLGLAAPALAYRAPDLLLRARGRARGARMDAELPDVLDLLRVAVGAGLPPGRALAEVGRRHPGELAAELRAAARREALGVPRAENLRELRRRAPAPGVPALAAALERAARHGAPLEEALAALAADARGRHARALAERAAKAAPKVQLLVALVLVPAVLLLVAAALVPALAGGAP